MHPELIIPQYITKVQLSKKQRPKYYTKKSKIPKSKKKYFFNSKGYLIDSKGDRIIANPRVAGKPKYEVLSGNKIKAGFGSPHIRAKIVKELKNFYRPFVQAYINKHGAITEFPLRIEWDVHTVVNDEPNWDADNLDFYFKYFQDCLFETTSKHNGYAKYKNKKLKQLIPDDTIEYITYPAAPKIIPIDNWDERKFVFRFYKDDRPELNRKPWI